MTPPAPSSIIELVDILNQEIAHLHRLAETATEERVALQRLAMPAFETVTQRRAQTLELLHVLEARRETILAELAREWGAVNAPITISTVIERVGHEIRHTLSGQQQEMDRLIGTVRQLMAVNRLAMTKLVEFIQHTLGAWQPVNGAEALYSGSGTKKAAQSSGRVVTQRG